MFELTGSKGWDILVSTFAEVAELADAQVSEACAARCEGSTPSLRTFLFILGEGTPH